MQSSKEITLKEYDSPQVTVPTPPQGYTDVPELFYDTLHAECKQLGEAVINHLPTSYSPYGYVIDFSAATHSHYENAINEAPEVVVQGLVAGMHMTERIVREHMNIEHLYHALTDADSEEIVNHPKIQQFIEQGCLEFLTGSQPLETLLFLYFRSQERNRSQHARGAFYTRIHTKLENAGFAVCRDMSIPGQPNIVVNNTEPVELHDNAVVGKALRTKQNDMSKRGRHAATCIGKMAAENHAATKVLVFNITDASLTRRSRAKHRNKILTQNPDVINKILFSDEIDELVDCCTEQIL